MENAIPLDPSLWPPGIGMMPHPWDMMPSIGGPDPHQLIPSLQSQNRFICNRCHKSYAQYTSLYNHKKFECGKPASLQCPYCEHRTKLKGNLKAHIMNKHSDLLLIGKESEKQTNQIAEKQEIRARPIGELIDSTLLSEIFGRKVSKYYSQRSPNQQDKNRCDSCGKAYSLVSSLINHKRFECGKGPNFKCPFCNHMTKQKGNMKTHIAHKHTAEYLEYLGLSHGHDENPGTGPTGGSAVLPL
ncbi:hypothetical protein LSTR_LSTR000966 [Laodelphax striatellus]|uniref:C2H2-type domain-containing protein n=1 Tax=Laodelphax striatellus TaxID=195883 RepID=A0A482X0T5_LAOST|nr:hypothetical protein LSTR_LSTR000966 [Laodelphax striatellus]